MSKMTNKNYMEGKSTKSKIMNYFEKYNKEIMCALMALNGSTIDYETFCDLNRK